MKRFVFALIFSVSFIISNAQYFQTGQDPASIKWRQLNTANFQIIYPDYYEAQAQKLASIMETVYREGGATLHYNPKKISIILHTQTVQSNGLVAWAPKRVEFYTIPHQNIYSQNWIEQLAIHEFRHVVQSDKINAELPKIIKLLLGQQGTALVFGAYIPWWFTEGDAVVMETALSNSGRGRVPSFLMEQKALAVEKGYYKYDKAYNSSYRDYVPDHYQLGYYLVGATRTKYGTELWNSVLNRVGNKPFSIVPFNKGIKKYTGLSKVQLYQSVFDSLKNAWVIQDKQYVSPNFTVVSPKSNTWSNYNYNHFLNDSVIISYKTALNKIPEFVKIGPHGQEHKIHNPGNIFNESVNYRGNWIVWSEQIPDPRWQHRGKSMIRLLNIESGVMHSFYTEYTAFAPSISADKEKLIVVESDYSSNYYLSVYRIVDGKLLHRFQTEKNNYFFSPDWLNNSEVVAVVLLPEGKRLAKINLETDEMELLSDNDLGEIKNLKVINNELYFTASLTGKNCIYKMNLNDKSIQQIYEPRFGAESADVSPDGEKIITSDYTADGFRLVEIKKGDLKPIHLDNVEKKNYLLADDLAKQEQGVIDFDTINYKNYPSKKYSKIAHLIHFHSWAPVAVDPYNYDISPGVSFLSQNKLGTAEINLGYKWKPNEKTGEFYGKYTFKGWYPIFDFEVNAGKSASHYMQIEQTKNISGEIVHQDTILKRFTWHETRINIDARLPLDLSAGKFTRLFQPEIKYNYAFYSHDSSTPKKFFQGNFQSFSYRLYYQQLLRRSYQDVFPNFGFTGDFIFQNSPKGNANLGNLFLEQTYIFLPGFMPNHGIRIYSGFQVKHSGPDYNFTDRIRYPRGWGKMNTKQAYSFGFDYKLPLFYPDWNVGSLVYLKRLKASVFADYANLTGDIYENGTVVGTFNTNISSFGVELTGDANFLRFYAPVEIGARASYLPEIKNVYFELLFSIDFSSL